jgi:TATA-box binding protein (TBP) (component of TFIID and TFIIIB)
MNDIDTEWADFMEGIVNPNVSAELKPSKDVPEPSEIYISTKSKIGYLNCQVDIKDIFWKIPILPYWQPEEGILKKQIKFVSIDEAELREVEEKIKDYECVDQQIITHINNPEGRIKFKDIRKLSIGVSRKDILSFHSKKKSAFYNCFVVIMRIKFDGVFREIHVKIFNTGKLEIPGIQNDSIYTYVLNRLIQLLRPFEGFSDVSCGETSETILINSNFSVGYYINRETLYRLLKDKYNIECIYDPCSYPGIQCKYYYTRDLITCDDDDIIQNISGQNIGENLVSVSFMIFRTGSVLIVGKCNEKILRHIYSYLKNIFKKEYANIFQNDTIIVKEKNKKIRRKLICVNI